MKQVSGEYCSYFLCGFKFNGEYDNMQMLLSSNKASVDCGAHKLHSAQNHARLHKTKFIRGYLMSYNIYYTIYHSINLCKCMHYKTLLANNCFIRRICTSFHDFIFGITQITIHFIHIKLL